MAFASVHLGPGIQVSEGGAGSQVCCTVAGCLAPRGCFVDASGRSDGAGTQQGCRPSACGAWRFPAFDFTFHSLQARGLTGQPSPRGSGPSARLRRLTANASVTVPDALQPPPTRAACDTGSRPAAAQGRPGPALKPTRLEARGSARAGRGGQGAPAGRAPGAVPGEGAGADGRRWPETETQLSPPRPLLLRGASPDSPSVPRPPPSRSGGGPMDTHGKTLGFGLRAPSAPDAARDPAGRRAEPQPPQAPRPGPEAAPERPWRDSSAQAGPSR